MLKVFDNLLHEVEVERIYNEIISLPYTVMEWDQEPEEVSGNRSDLSESNYSYFCLYNYIKNNISEVEDMELSQAYVNHFAPREIPYFHIDSSDERNLTVLYYADVWENYDINEGGGTEFLLKDSLTTVLPETGRLVCFSSNLVHRATTYRDNHRFTIAFKFKHK